MKDLMPARPSKEQMDKWDCDGGNSLIYQEDIALINGKLYAGKLARIQNALTKSKHKIKQLLKSQNPEKPHSMGN
jgi:hypothetical protein